MRYMTTVLGGKVLTRPVSMLMVILQPSQMNRKRNSLRVFSGIGRFTGWEVIKTRIAVCGNGLQENSGITRTGLPDNYSAIDQAPQGYLVFSIEYDAWDDQQEKGASAGPTSVAEGAAGYICEWDYDMEKTE